ncbi:hypothetical protein HHI36_001174 [Cryptolaemus montrouzieri]|uniref:Uncharacterized protein n=1 Tax=Cryptolaemus montrouzieri TaxID=559131 RepID=A0ABD2P7H2_9CUCU
MLPKSDRTQDPSQYRPIACLPTLYKMPTSCISNRIYKHLDDNNIFAEEQKGCRKKHHGCKYDNETGTRRASECSFSFPRLSSDNYSIVPPILGLSKYCRYTIFIQPW